LSESELTVALATPLHPGLRHLLADVDERVRLLVDDELLPSQRFPGDHDGDPDFRRTAAQQRAFEELLRGADVFYGIPDTKPAALNAAVRGNRRLRWVHTMAAGGGAQVKAARLGPDELARVTFTSSAGVHGATLAEFAVFGVIAGAKDLPRLRSQQAAHDWADRWTMRQVHEMTVVVVGLGGIGARTAQLLTGLGARVLGVKRHPEPVDGVDEVFGTDALRDVVSRADAIVFTVPGTSDTEKLYDAAMIAATKPGAIVVNVGRGTVIDEAAMIDALLAGQLSSAFLDVFEQEPLPADSPLWDMPQVVVSPHTAALSDLEDKRIAELFAVNLRRLLDGRPLLNVIDTEQFY
jgi:phosphoglycerate dehydrogenase-like enzyme